MKAIKTTHEVLREVREQGFSELHACDLHFSKDLNSSISEFVTDWENLVIDKYMEDRGKYRLRRYGRFIFNSQIDSISFQGKVQYFQSEELNPVNGGSNRQFAPLLDHSVTNEFLHELIKFDFSQLPANEKRNDGLWTVGVHQIRILAEPSQHGLPAPEGIHKDGEMFTVQHLIRRHNITGGANSIYDNDKKLIYEWTQQSNFDSYYFEDEAVWHSVSEISSKDQKNRGIRDILLIDFDPVTN